MKKSIEQLGILVSIIIASVSLPTAVISLNQDPIINNYNSYNIYNNQTDSIIQYPPTTITLVNLEGPSPEWFYHQLYNLTGNHVINWYVNKSFAAEFFYVYMIQDYLFEVWNATHDSAYAYNAYGFSTSMIYNREWTVPFSDVWHFSWVYKPPSATSVDITIRTIVSEIG